MLFLVENRNMVAFMGLEALIIVVRERAVASTNMSQRPDNEPLKNLVSTYNVGYMI